ncbi:MlaA family lipoprotein [Polaromonas naphthalenivorans]|uniref:VacJ family lipoprotein n=1 Tax=Polaromonas naphthalenivorans (strain CJ2) TaxID=365044 RepID=A1VK29_POLNA|nr:VacJ family lipoprotein [Polaromonas naphthalenivorans]ABM36007.1 VacJ family lipoprotein [Polaromonas naphthalenivorans CJ2]
MTKPIHLKKATGWAAAALAFTLLQGCATGPQANPADPLEPFNRSVYSFNEGLDRAVLKPVATAYQNITPAPVRTGVTSFFENISDVWSFVNNVLQAKPAEAMDSLFRVTTNTLWGLGGIFDVASELKIPKHKEDFGQTLGTWGLKSGPYVVLPLFGPSSVRDSAGLVVDLQGNPLSQVDNVPVRNSLTGLRLVDTRASLLSAGDLLDQAALDKYAFTRDAYLQRRQSLIGGGNERIEPEERFDLPEAAPAGAPAASAPNPQ